MTSDAVANMYKLCINNIMDEKLRQAVKAAMVERGVRQQALARQCRLSQGHLSKVLKSLQMGSRTRNRLQKWLDSSEDNASEGLLDAEDLLRLGALLKGHCEALAMARRNVGWSNAANEGHSE